MEEHTDPKGIVRAGMHDDREGIWRSTNHMVHTQCRMTERPHSVLEPHAPMALRINPARAWKLASSLGTSGCVQPLPMPWNA